VALWTFTAAILPPLAMALILGGLGMVVLGPRLSGDSIVPAAILGLLLFVGMMGFKRFRGWNAALMTAFSFVCGGVVSWIFEGQAGGTWLGAIASAALVLALGAIVGRRTNPRPAGLGAWLWLLSWVYLFGWVAAAIVGPPAVWIRAWAAAGLVVYAGLSATWFADLDPLEPDPSGTAWAIDLILLGFNLAIAARVLMWEPG
jgi:uncharacterized membrane protein (UPF0136 family)